jgi:hypothetical protein
VSEYLAGWPWSEAQHSKLNKYGTPNVKLQCTRCGQNVAIGEPNHRFVLSGQLIIICVPCATEDIVDDIADFGGFIAGEIPE